MSFLNVIYTDVHFALRLLRRSPGFAVTLLGVLIVGIGATTAMFSLVTSLLLRPLPYTHPEQLTMVWATQPHVNPSPVSVADFLDWRSQSQGTTFETMAAVEYDAVSLSSEGEKPEHLPGANVSGDFFPMFGITPIRGRFFGVEDDRVGGPRVAVISASLWHKRFASDASIIGRTISLNAEPYTVIGIASEGFRFAGPYSNRCDVWTPLAVTHRNYAHDAVEERGSHFLHVMGRRKAGITLEQAQAHLTGIATSLAAKYPDSNLGVGIKALDLHDALAGSSRADVWVLFAAVGLVFLVVCANVANLLLARAASRRAEMAARAALGATRRRLIAQLVTETVVIFVLGALGGTLLSRWLVGLFADGVISGRSYTKEDVHVDVTSLAFAIGTALLCGLVFGLVPAAEASRVDPQAVLKDSGARAPIGSSQRVVRGGLIIAQVALAFALLVGSGLALRAFAKVAATPPGFDPESVATASITLPAAKYGVANGSSFAATQDEKLVAFYNDAIARVAAQPGVTSVGANTSVPMSNSNWSGSFQIEGRPPWPPGARPVLERDVITPGYFKTMGIPILRGRDFNESDVKGGRLVLIISQAAAEKFFPGEDPLGHRIDWGAHDDDTKHMWCEIVGIAGDVRKHGLSRPLAVESYAPLAQHPLRWVTIVARTQHPDALLQEMPSIIAAVDSEQAVSSRRLMRDQVAATIGPQRFVTILLGAFAAVALLLATLGIFGLVSYTTSQRTRELGIRLALGSSPEGVIRVVMREGLLLLGIGLAVGLIGAVFVGRAMADRVSGAASFDPMVVGSILGILALAGTLASLLPALRAVRIPPAVALRYE
jgi:putative ABC transport system permease protein